MKVKFFSTLRQIVGGKAVDLNLGEAATVQQLLDEMIRCYPALQDELLDENGRLYGHVHMFVNGRDSNFLEKGMDTVLAPDDVIGIFPAVGGG
ncbi:MAG: ubiquitin-like small modifier protein 1 [Omnitrophica WOR_2 bacterium]